nr:zinc finger, CCHC-type [Tanacetum cinerariifolium]
METILKAYGIWETIVAKGETTNEKKDNTSKAIIFQTLPQDMLMQVAQYTTTKEVWNSIKVKHLGADLVQKARLQTLSSEFETLKMKPRESTSEFAGKLSSIQAKFKSLGGRITAFEERLKSQDKPENNYQNKLLLASSNNQGGGRGHGRNFTKNKSSNGKGMHEMEKQEERQRARSTSHLGRRRTHIAVKSSEKDVIITLGGDCLTYNVINVKLGYLEELVREFPLHYPSWRQMLPERKAGVMAKNRASSSTCKRTTMARRLLSKKDIGFLNRTGIMTWSASDADVPLVINRRLYGRFNRSSSAACVRNHWDSLDLLCEIRVSQIGDLAKSSEI